MGLISPLTGCSAVLDSIVLLLCNGRETPVAPVSIGLVTLSSDET